jgi:hypothetical protein
MTTMSTTHQTAEQRSVIDWRRDQLLEAGFSPALAARIAGDRRWDVHALIELVERGCPPRLAARIVAPLDDGRAAA